jgi:hypothetical protein
MSIHEHLPKTARHELKQVGWAKAAELVKVARSDGKRFESATWLHKARELPSAPDQGGPARLRCLG